MVQKIRLTAIGLLFILLTGLALTACGNRTVFNLGKKETGEEIFLGPERELLVAVNADGISHQLAFDSVWMNRSEFWGSLVFRGLLIADDNINDVETDMCEEYAVSPDGLSYVFTLQKDISWHDGKAVAMEDIVWSIETFLQVKESNGYVAQGLKKIRGAEEWIAGEADSLAGLEVDGNDLTIHLSQKEDNFLSCIAQLAILPSHCFTGMEVDEIYASDFWKMPIGNGPYRMISNEDGEAVLVINEQYTGKRPGIEQIRFKVVDPKNPGEFDFTLTSDPNVISRYQKNSAYKVVPTSNLYYRYLIFNLDCRSGDRDGRLDDEKVRRALMYGLDRRSIINNIYQDTAIVLDCGIPREDSWYIEKSEDTVGYRPTLAKKMLKEAGFDFNAPLILTRYNTDALSVKLLEDIAACWEAIGIKTEIIPINTGDTNRLFVEADWYDIALKNLSAVDYNEWYYEYSTENVLFSNLYQNRDGFDALLQSLDNSNWAYEKSMCYREIQNRENELVYKIPLAIVPQYVIYREEKLSIPLNEFPNMWYYYDLELAKWKITSSGSEK